MERPPGTAVKPSSPSTPTWETFIWSGMRSPPLPLLPHCSHEQAGDKQAAHGQRSRSADARWLLAPLLGEHQSKTASNGESKHQGLL